MQGQCPKCKSFNIHYEPMELQDNDVYYPLYCEDCHYEGREWYHLEYIETT
jgi:hypothetical protein